MRILGIETSCDETSVAVVEDGCRVRSNVISSSKAAFEALAGVIPEEAARKQLECMLPVLEQALKEAKCTPKDIDLIAVTRGPGLLGSLLVGTMTARALARSWGKPLIGVHHTLGHLSSTWLEAPTEPTFPLLCLSASGGHTELWYRKSHTDSALLGRTRDDAAGEVFDKGASMLGLPYPGGPEIERCAKEGNPMAVAFPRPLHEDPGMDFSFSGLKTALKYTLRDLGEIDAPKKADVAASYQHAICAHLADRLKSALRSVPDALEIHVVGGVAANSYLRSLLLQMSVPVRTPTKISYCTDNGAMIAAAGYFVFKEFGTHACEAFETSASLKTGELISLMPAC